MHGDPRDPVSTQLCLRRLLLLGIPIEKHGSSAAISALGTLAGLPWAPHLLAVCNRHMPALTLGLRGVCTAWGGEVPSLVSTCCCSGIPSQTPPHPSSCTAHTDQAQEPFSKHVETTAGSWAPVAQGGDDSVSKEIGR